MVKSTIIQVSPDELADLICKQIKNELQQLSIDPKVNQLMSDRPHLTRKETASFFDVSLNCITNWSNKGILKPIKMGQRTYFKKSDLLDVMFNQLKK